MKFTFFLHLKIVYMSQYQKHTSKYHASFLNMFHNSLKSYNNSPSFRFSETEVKSLKPQSLN